MAKSKVDSSNILSSFKKPATKKPVPKKVEINTAVSEIHRGKIQRTSVDFEETFHRNLKMKALERGLSFRALIMEYMEEGLRKDL